MVINGNKEDPTGSEEKNKPTQFIMRTVRHWVSILGRFLGLLGGEPGYLAWMRTLP